VQREISYVVITGIIIPLEAVIEIAEQIPLPEYKYNLSPEYIIRKLVKINFHIFIRPQHNNFPQ